MILKTTCLNMIHNEEQDTIHRFNTLANEEQDTIHRFNTLANEEQDTIHRFNTLANEEQDTIHRFNTGSQSIPISIDQIAPWSVHLSPIIINWIKYEMEYKLHYVDSALYLFQV